MENNIGRIDLYGRNDNVAVQLQGFNLYISNCSKSGTNTRPVFHDNESSVAHYIERKGHYTILVGDIRGQYVSVSLYTTTLVVCELQAFTACPDGHFEPDWAPCSCGGRPCNKSNGSCFECPTGSYGVSCLPCGNCLYGNLSCDKVTGQCPGGCAVGFNGPTCHEECSYSSFGPNCSKTCHCIEDSHCNHVSGKCDQGLCDPGWQGPSCDRECSNPSFGSNCSHTCHCENDSKCDHVVGICCPNLCAPGWTGPSCDQGCVSPYFGPNCVHTCHCINDSNCDHVTGACELGLCDPGWQGSSCDQEKPDLFSVLPHAKNQDGSDSMGLVIVVVLLTVTCVAQTVCVAVLWTRLRNIRQKNNSKREEDNSVPNKSYVNEMADITPNIQNLPGAPENDYQPVENVDDVNIDSHPDYQGLCYRNNTERAYSMLSTDNRPVLNTAPDSADVHVYTNMAIK